MNLRKLDALVAEKVMGIQTKPFADGSLHYWKKYPGGDRDGWDGEWKPVEHYSSSIEAAWEVVERLKIAVVGQYDHGWGVWVDSYPNCDDAMGVTQAPDAQAPSAPLAICIAALRAKGVDYQEATSLG